MAQPAPAREPIISAPHPDIYKDGGYLKKNATWHVEEPPFKAKYIMEMLRRNDLSPRTICEAGCGAGEVLRQLQLQMGADHEFWGSDISPPAIEFRQPREHDKLHFKLADLGKERSVSF